MDARVVARPGGGHPARGARATPGGRRVRRIRSRRRPAPRPPPPPPPPDAAFDHGAIRWEEPKAKRARLAAQIDRRPVQGDVDKTVYVKNLSYRAAEGALAEFFGQCGEIFDLRLGRDDQGKSRGFCHVAFKTTEAAEKALELNDSNFFGRDILVQMAKTEEQRNAERDERRASSANRPPAAPPTGCWFVSPTRRTSTSSCPSRGNRSCPWIRVDSWRITVRWCRWNTCRRSRRWRRRRRRRVWRYLAAARSARGAGRRADARGGWHARAEGEMVVFERHLALRSKRVAITVT